MRTEFSQSRVSGARAPHTATGSVFFRPGPALRPALHLAMHAGVAKKPRRAAPAAHSRAEGAVCFRSLPEAWLATMLTYLGFEYLYSCARPWFARGYVVRRVEHLRQVCKHLRGAAADAVLMPAMKLVYANAREFDKHVGTPATATAHLSVPSADYQNLYTATAAVTQFKACRVARRCAPDRTLHICLQSGDHVIDHALDHWKTSASVPEDMRHQLHWGAKGLLLDAQVFSNVVFCGAGRTRLVGGGIYVTHCRPLAAAAAESEADSDGLDVEYTVEEDEKRRQAYERASCAAKNLAPFCLRNIKISHANCDGIYVHGAGHDWKFDQTWRTHVPVCHVRLICCTVEHSRHHGIYVCGAGTCVDIVHTISAYNKGCGVYVEGVADVHLRGHHTRLLGNGDEGLCVHHSNTHSTCHWDPNDWEVPKVRVSGLGHAPPRVHRAFNANVGAQPYETYHKAYVAGCKPCLLFYNTKTWPNSHNVDDPSLLHTLVYWDRRHGRRHGADMLVCGASDVQFFAHMFVR